MHVRTGKALAEQLEVARNYFARAFGLMFRRSLEPGHGMWIVPCNGITMLFMRFPIDAVFLDRQERVKKVYTKLPPWWGTVWLVLGAHSVLELPSGSTADLGLMPGDQINIG